VDWLLEVVRSNVTFVILLAMMGLDIVTGTLKAFVKRTLNSKLSREGMVRKAATLLMILTCAVFQPIFTQVTGQTGIKLSSVVSVGFIIVEFWSNIENLDACGVPFPKYLKDLLETARQKVEQKQVGIVTIVTPPPLEAGTTTTTTTTTSKSTGGKASDPPAPTDETQSGAWSSEQ
jgi:toxin secretion/phage lysis holin